MKTIKGKICIFLFGVIICFSVHSQNAADFKTQLQDGYFVIMDYIGNSKDVVIPESINGTPVAAINHKAFYEKGLTSIKIPDSIQVIGMQAFSLNKLTEVTIPDSVKNILMFAFTLNNLTSITIPRDLELSGIRLNAIENIFSEDFDRFYRDNGKKAGTYIKDGTAWKLKL